MLKNNIKLNRNIIYILKVFTDIFFCIFKEEMLNSLMKYSSVHLIIQKLGEKYY